MKRHFSDSTDTNQYMSEPQSNTIANSQDL